ncbi:MAG: sulfatase [Phycisphaerales bacterium]|nr:sulfatase [Phycisphaerales bacterium]
MIAAGLSLNLCVQIATSSVGANSSTAGTASAPADVVLVVVDDLGWADASCMPDGRHETPAIDGLAEAGTLFTHASANGPNCAPARASLMTGLWPPNHGVLTVAPIKRGPASLRKMHLPPSALQLQPGQRTIATALRDSGWHTVHIGKWHLGNDPTKHGFDVNIGGSNKGHPKSHFSPYLNPTLPDGPEGECLTDRLVDEAIAQLSEDRDEPVFLHLSFYDVHTPLQAHPDCLQETKEEQSAWTLRQAKYDCMVRRTDAAIGRLLEHVKDDSLILLCSDHGGVGRLAHSGQLRGCKGQLLEGGIRTPLIIAGPGIEAGRVCDTPMSLHDLVPTIADWFGLEVVDNWDGHSLAPLLQGRSMGANAPAQYWHYPYYLGAAGAVAGQWRTTPVSAIRVGDWKLMEYLEDGSLALFDLHDDSGEQVNLADQRPAIRDTMLLLLQAWRHRVDAPMPTPL